MLFIYFVTRLHAYWIISIAPDTSLGVGEEFDAPPFVELDASRGESYRVPLCSLFGVESCEFVTDSTEYPADVSGDDVSIFFGSDSLFVAGVKEGPLLRCCLVAIIAKDASAKFFGAGPVYQSWLMQYPF